MRNRFKVVGYLVLLCVLFVTFVPFLWMILMSLQETHTLFTTIDKLIPEKVTLSNYVRVLNESPFGRWVLNSLLVAIVVTGTNLFFCSMAGYVFAKKQFPGKSLLFLILMSTLMIPKQVILIPLFALIRQLGLINTYWALILPMSVDAFGIFLMRQFIAQIPTEIEEAAIIDGCSDWKIFWRIIIPLCKPALSSLAIFIFMWTWNDFVWPLIAVTDAGMRTVTVGVTIFEGRYLSNWGIVMAACVMALIPMVAVFVSLQKYFVQGIAMTGIKG